MPDELPPHLKGYERLVNHIVSAALRTPEPWPGFWRAAIMKNDIRLRPRGERVEIIVGGRKLCDGPLSLLAGISACAPGAVLVGPLARMMRAARTADMREPLP